MTVLYIVIGTQFADISTTTTSPPGATVGGCTIRIIQQQKKLQEQSALNILLNRGEMLSQVFSSFFFFSTSFIFLSISIRQFRGSLLSFYVFIYCSILCLH